jgi:hypothetical protein
MTHWPFLDHLNMRIRKKAPENGSLPTNLGFELLAMSAEVFAL